MFTQKTFRVVVSIAVITIVYEHATSTIVLGIP